MDTTLPAPLAPAAPNAGDYQLIHADTDDEMLVEMWITKPRRARSRHTHDQYRRVWTSLRQALRKPLQTIKVDDLLRWANDLQGTPNTAKLQVAAVKSL